MQKSVFVQRYLPCPTCGEPTWGSVPKDTANEAATHDTPCWACKPAEPISEDIRTISFPKAFVPYYHKTLDTVVTSTADFDRKCEEKGLYCLGDNVKSELDSISRNKPDDRPVLTEDEFCREWEKAGQKYGRIGDQAEDDD